ncbi:hypothetical protein [Ancylobacter lacus]|uniref:hypothetical protein n=1 Tax=Ancylobacter lacus TaxID=2579970 RepID=UPI001BCA7540|nr:hypothetical protein [Ancylobacter lacus]MBS7537549.1 hypothetical protein [Ancylobacter lacus]
MPKKFASPKPIILGFVLGKVMAVNLRNALAIGGGEPSILFQSPISLILWALAIVVAVGPWALHRGARRSRSPGMIEGPVQPLLPRSVDFPTTAEAVPCCPARRPRFGTGSPAAVRAIPATAPGGHRV